MKQMQRKLRAQETPTPIISKEQFLKFCEENLSNSMTELIKISLKNSSTTPHGFRYTAEFKQFALTIYFLSPKVYKFLRKPLSLPSKSTLYRITNKWQIFPGLNDFVFEAIKSKVSLLNDMAKDCTLCVDEMSIKRNLFYHRGRDKIIGLHETLIEKQYSPAKNVFTLMARGIFANWKQPVAYFFVDKCTGVDLKPIIFETIKKLEATGLRIHALISDQGSNNRSFASSVGVTPESPYFFVENKKIFYIYDVPHLIKSTRNNFFKYTFKTPEGPTSKSYVEILYKTDKAKRFGLRLCPKLTDDHLNTSSFKKMKVKFATQIFSATVAAALNTYIEHGKFPPAATATVTFIENMDRLFDILNSSQLKTNKEYNKPFAGADYQIQFLKEMYNLWDNLEILEGNKDVSKNIKFNIGWKITINSILGLWDKFNSNKIKFLFTRRLNQDCLENFFGKVRQQGGNCLNPTSVQFDRAFKKLFCLNYFQHSDGSNCIDDLDSLLLASTPQQTEVFAKIVKGSAPFINLAIETVDYVNLDIRERNSISYVCGYLLRKCLDQHECDVCIEYTKNCEKRESDTFTYFKAYQHTEIEIFGKLISPPEEFLSYISLLEQTFCEIFPKYAAQNNLGIKIKSDLLNCHKFKHPCGSFPYDFLVSLYVRLRIFSSLKFLNRDMVTSTNKKNYKLANLQHL